MLGVPAHPLRALGLREADDAEMFRRAAHERAIILTKDADFRLLLERHGPPPRIIWLTYGNTSNAAIRAIMTHHASALRQWINGDGGLIEIA